MQGRAAAPGAGTVLNALATGVGSAFALDVETRAEVCLSTDADSVVGAVDGDPDADTTLVERCVERTLARWGEAAGVPASVGGTVRTESDVPMAAGLKSSSAAANATVLATLDALGLDALGHDAPNGSTDSSGTDIDGGGPVPLETACREGVAAARDAGVTVTGAFDDASASMLGGVTVTDNATDELLARERFDHDAIVWTPPERAYSADADAERCGNVAPVAELVADLALAGEYETAMTVNGLAFSAALGFSADPAVEAMPHAAGVSLSGTGPSVVAVGESGRLDAVAERWEERPGTLLRTTTRNEGGRIL